MLHERDSFFDRHKRHFGRLLEPAKSEIVVFAKAATLSGFDSAVHEQKDSTSWTRAKGKLLRWVEQRTLG